MKKIVIPSIILGVIITPIILSQILRLPYGSLTIGNEESWVSFFGSYIGGVIGGVVAFSAAWLQINQEKRQNKINILYKELPIYVGLSLEFQKIITHLKVYKRIKEMNKNVIDENFFRSLVIELDALIWDRWENKNISDTILLKELLKFEESFKRMIEVFEFNVQQSEEKATELFNLNKISNSNSLLRTIETYVKEKEHYWNEIEFCLEKAEKLEKAILSRISSIEQVIDGKLDIKKFQQFSSISDLRVNRIK